MDLFAACDICGHRYVLSADRGGRQTKCKSCDTSFKISETDDYDPETSEFDTDQSDQIAPNSSLMTTLTSILSNSIAAVVTIVLLIWMSSLLFRSPQAVVMALRDSQPATGTSRSSDVSRSRPKTVREKLQQPPAPIFFPKSAPNIPTPQNPPTFNPPAGNSPTDNPPVNNQPQIQLPRGPRSQPQIPRPMHPLPFGPPNIGPPNMRPPNMGQPPAGPGAPQ